MAKRTDQWPWRSFSTTIGNNNYPKWQQTNWVLSQFGKKRKQAITDYVNFVQAGVGLPSVWDSLRKQIFLGSEIFVYKMQRHMKSDQNISEILRAQ
ncbi:hypothetical protein SAMN05216419_10579 [Nitrosomonas cryotolerans]|uniref:hypothetical protein n=1 Tax=Nitrosomonas cryotolerans TaxID=44575 RepID=UPI0008E7EFD5|nr:hypothetical protein [Nitrosomonas cryotolerans]SFQ07989.1 hypothetical protein SAMN05216419_10579 [Nitrosomonas cryotolerans]